MNLETLYDCYRGMSFWTPLVRTDFSDDDTWDKIVAAVTRPAFFDARDDIDPMPEDPDYEAYRPIIKPISDPSFDGVALDDLIASWRPDRLVGYMLYTDERTFREARAGGEITVLYVDLWDNEEAHEHPDWWPDWTFGQSFRCTTRAIANIECNLDQANTSFSDHYDQREADGVVRWHL